MGSVISQLFVQVDTIPHTFGGFVQLCFLAGVYGYILCYSSNMIKDGSELLLLVPALAGVVGSIVLPVLGAVPDGAIVIFSGLGDNAQEEVAVGVGALAGSTIMLLTVPWMLAVLAGRVNIVDTIPQYSKPKSWPLGLRWSKLTPADAYKNTGVMCGPSIKKSAMVMLITLLPYLIIQIPAAMHKCVLEKDSQHGRCQTPEWASLLGGILATLFFVFYLVYQARMANEDPVKEDKIDELRKDAVRNHLVSIRGLFPEKAVDREGAVPISAENKRFQSYIRPFFRTYDIDNSGTIDQNEFHLLLKDLNENPTKQQLEDLMKEVDVDGSGDISFDEFAVCVAKIITDETFLQRSITGHSRENAKQAAAKKSSREEMPLLGSGVQREEGAAEEAEEEEDEEEVEIPEDLADLSPEEQQKRILRRAFLLMGVGVAVVLLFSDPMVDVLSELGNHTGIKPFYIAFVLAPLASNASELIAAYSYALKKTEKTITISFASLIGAACMNNTFCLALFLFLIYARKLQWVFSAETISIILVEVIMFFFAIRRVHKWYTGFIVVSLFPLAIALVATLEAIGLD